jgi:hypothetical protein
MLECFERAIKEGFAILVLNPNFNSIMLPPDEGSGETAPRKVRIEDSSSPEEHTLGVWENLIRSSEYKGEICLFSYGNGASLAKDILLRNLSYEQDSIYNILAVALVEAR